MRGTNTSISTHMQHWITHLPSSNLSRVNASLCSHWQAPSLMDPVSTGLANPLVSLPLCYKPHRRHLLCVRGAAGRGSSSKDQQAPCFEPVNTILWGFARLEPGRYLLCLVYCPVLLFVDLIHFPPYKGPAAEDISCRWVMDDSLLFSVCASWSYLFCFKGPKQFTPWNKWCKLSTENKPRGADKVLDPDLVI